MSHTEYVHCGVYVAVMNRVAFAAHPFSNPKTLSTFWAAYRTATGTGLGCEVFRDLTVHHLPRNRFISKKVAERGPTGIIDRFGQVRFCQFGTADIPYHDQLAFLSQPMRFLMQKILAPIRNLGL